MHLRLTACGVSSMSVITYSMAPPTSSSRCAVNRTPQELIFFVKPESASRCDPARVRASGNCSLNLRVLRCSTDRGSLSASLLLVNSTMAGWVLGYGQEGNQGVEGVPAFAGPLSRL